MPVGRTLSNASLTWDDTTDCTLCVAPITLAGGSHPATPSKGVSTFTHKLCNPILLDPRKSVILDSAPPTVGDGFPHMHSLPPQPVTGFTAKLPQLHLTHKLIMWPSSINTKLTLLEGLQHSRNPLRTTVMITTNIHDPTHTQRACQIRNDVYSIAHVNNKRATKQSKVNIAQAHEL